ncbi:N-alpha-acetyltransferase 60 [Neocloeon triangulifer]|uniref:N-alpha-acetyltransferase 60 n=1 Tax=Neocloeon triangulifer TaxID=2078957 RepID=UPI00286EF825|nr:N-alpha-acetyltransferase 60 [Neocloeon triangulifer]
MAGISWYSCEYTRSSPVPLCSLANLQLRFLCPADLEEVRHLCQDWFPIEYPDSWYHDITSDPRFYSLAAIYGGIIIGLIVAEIKSYSKLSNEDGTILSVSPHERVEVGYILSLGVSKVYRRNGIASLLLENLIFYLTTSENIQCKALFLHVLTTNTAAIHFYEQRRFKLHSFLPYYYSIQGKSKDGFMYVLYINGGHPPWNLVDYVKHYCEVLVQADPCSVPMWIWGQMQALTDWIWPRVGRAAHSTSTLFW